MPAARRRREARSAQRAAPGAFESEECLVRVGVPRRLDQFEVAEMWAARFIFKKRETFGRLRGSSHRSKDSEPQDDLLRAEPRLIGENPVPEYTRCRTSCSMKGSAGEKSPKESKACLNRADSGSVRASAFGRASILSENFLQEALKTLF